jgi:uncharacterized caspase-like protein
MIKGKLAAGALGVLLAIAAAVAPALAERRLALVIGNNVYANMPPIMQLQKAVNDADAVGDALSRLGFEVIQGRNLGRQGMVDKISDLAAKIQPGDTVAFFYAGHGVAIGGVNYLVPSDVPRTTEGAESRVRGASIAEGDIVAEIQSKGARLALLVLDACRDNPFPRTGGRSIGNTRGLADVKPARGVFTIYSAGIGQSALDRLDDVERSPNSVFTRVFVEQLMKPDLHLADLAVEVRERVAALALQAKNEAGQIDPHEQTPAYYDQTLGGRIYLGRLPGTRKVALIIGNAAYAHVTPLTTPRHEAEALGEAFRRLNFDSVRVVTDLTHAGMLAALRDFASAASGADWAVLHFAGHGVQVKNENYVVPVDAKFARPDDAAGEAVALSALLAAVDPAKALRLVMVDANRDDPFGSSGKGPRSDGVPRLTRPGTMLLYSAGHDEMVSEDGGSAFAKSLGARLDTTGLDLAALVRLVQADVEAATKQQQKPVLYGSVPSGIRMK